MRLGLDLLFLIPGETGGRETYARELISTMYEIEPELTATAFVNRDARVAFTRELGSNMRVVRVPVSPRRPAQWAAGELLCLPVAAARAQIDLLHSLANFGPASGRFRRVLTVHDLQYRTLPELLSGTRRTGTAALLGLAVHRAHRLITVSAFCRAELIAGLSVSPDRIEVIPNGAGARKHPSALGEHELRERYQLETRPVVLAVASDQPHKNLSALLDAIALIPSDRRPLLVLAGRGTDGAKLGTRARATGVEADVRLLGIRSAEELDALYALAACAVMPSLYEGFGLPVLEAMSRGVPVACSDIPALREVAGDAALRFSPTSAVEIAAAVERLTDDGALAKRLRAAGRTRAARFSWTAAAEATLRCYRRTLDPAGAPPR